LEDLKRDERKREAFFTVQRTASQEKASQQAAPPQRRPSRDAVRSPDITPPLHPGSFPIGRKGGQADSTPSGSASHAPRARGPPARPSRTGEVDSFLVQLKEEGLGYASASGDTMRSDMRSNTFPLGQPLPTVQRRPSEPLSRREQLATGQQPISTSINTATRPQAPLRSVTMPYEPSTMQSLPHSNSRNILRSDHSFGRLPIAPSVVTSLRETGMHAPSDSGSSTTSLVSAGRSSSGTTASPPLSAASSISTHSAAFEGAGKVPGVFQSGYASQSRAQVVQYDSWLPDTTPTSQTTTVLPQPPQQQPSWTPAARPYAPFVRSNTDGPTNFSTPRLPKVASIPESPIDPGLRWDTTTQAGTINTAAVPYLPNPGPTKYAQDIQSASSAPQLARAPQREASTGQRSGTGSRHVCRGCNEPIVGKSVKAADGRLTGRYHKPCFSCKTCRSPFTTGDFYVFDNDPYCEHHYHELNGSLCAGCGKGIEGQYLETQQRMQKFHPDCFTCITCRTALNEDYFEIGGKVFCERHAFAVTRAEGGLGPKRDLERRTTRLMMM